MRQVNRLNTIMSATSRAIRRPRFADRKDAVDPCGALESGVRYQVSSGCSSGLALAEYIEMATSGQRQPSSRQRSAGSTRPKEAVSVAPVQFGMRLGVLTGIQGRSRLIKAQEKGRARRRRGQEWRGFRVSGAWREMGGLPKLNEDEAYFPSQNSRFLRMYSRHLDGTVNSSKMALTGHTDSQ